MRINSKNLVYYHSIWGKGPFIRFMISLDKKDTLIIDSIKKLLERYSVDLDCEIKNSFHLLSHLVIGISQHLQDDFKSECIQKNSIEENELRVPILYRNTSITILEEILDWLSNKKKSDIIGWEKNHFPYIKKEYYIDKESKVTFFFRNWLIQNAIPVYEYEYSRDCWIIGEGKNKFVLYRTPELEDKLVWSKSFSKIQDERKELIVNKDRLNTNGFQIVLNEIMKEKKSFDLRIPIFLITGTNGKTTTARMIARILQETENKVGLTTSTGLSVNNKIIEEGDLTGPWSARNLLALDDISFGVIETARGGILKEGVVVASGFEGASVITNIAEDHLGMKGINTLEEMTQVKFKVVDSILDTKEKKGRVILNADDKYLMKKAVNYELDQFWFFSLNKTNVSKFSVGIYLENKKIHFFNKKLGIDKPLISILDVPATFEGNAEFNITNALAAAATCLSFGIPIDLVSSGLKSFKPDFLSSMGRSNLIPYKNFNIFIDYAHNPHGMDAIIPLLHSIKANHKFLITMIAGDRDNQFIREMSKKYLEISPDMIIIKELRNTRGRKKGEVAELLKTELKNAGYNEKNLIIKLDEQEAFKFGLSICAEDDLLIAFTEKIDNIRDLIEK